ncbi:hypothetical protein OG905_25925 [Streptomyces sp. NBC_00322]|uniref:hypothetical protein n=1 Tax=Streptomyces sp. NBC_00322 TaxID=2975712 RepID=UPI002E2DB08F|nr:hypothetical protein [Streptomyces sp. NBC_00322]
MVGDLGGDPLVLVALQERRLFRGVVVDAGQLRALAAVRRAQLRIGVDGGSRFQGPVRPAFGQDKTRSAPDLLCQVKG